MCTVTYVFSAGKAILTSNRDELVTRQSTPPQWHTIEKKNILYPSEPKAGGTWFATDEFGNTAVLLNGLQPEHVTEAFTKSRGLIIPNVLASTSPCHALNEIDLNNVQAFVLILYTGKKLMQLRWDGYNREIQTLDPLFNYIWSSAPLFDANARHKKELQFREFLLHNPYPNEEQLYKFHNPGPDEDRSNSFIVNRNGIVQTLSITQFTNIKDNCSLKYVSLSDTSEYTYNIHTGNIKQKSA